MSSPRRVKGTGSKKETAPGVWLLQLGVGKDASGRRLRVTKVFHGTAAGAERALRALSAADAPAAKSDTVESLITAWMANVTLAPTTQADYLTCVKNYIAPAFGQVRIDRLTARQVDEFYRDLERTLSASRVARVHGILSAAFKQGVKWGMLTSSPIAGTTPPTPKRKDPRVPSDEQVARILEAAEASDGFRMGLFVRMAATLGCRRGELAGLQWSDIDWVSHEIRIQRSISETPASGRMVGPTKTGKNRTIKIGGTVLGLLMVERGRTTASLPWVFSETIEPPRPDRFTQAYERIVDSLEIDTSLNHLRHWSATSAIVAGVDPVTVAGRLGHSPRMTLETYAAYRPAADHAAAFLLDDLV